MNVWLHLMNDLLCGLESGAQLILYFRSELKRCDDAR
jgi:hypothetical protein